MDMLRKALGIAAAIMIAQPSDASGPSGNVIPSSVSLETGRVYVFGSFSNPDKCATSNVVVLVSADKDELNRMFAAALTAIAANKPLSLWLSDCVSVPWYPSAPQATTVGIVR